MKKRFPLKQKVIRVKHMNDQNESDNMGFPRFNVGDRPKECQKLLSLTRYMYDGIDQLATKAEVSMQEVMYQALEEYLVQAVERKLIVFPKK